MMNQLINGNKRNLKPINSEITELRAKSNIFLFYFNMIKKFYRFNFIYKNS